MQDDFADPKELQLFEELRGGHLTLFLLMVIAEGEEEVRKSKSGEGLRHGTAILNELSRLNHGGSRPRTSVGNGIYYARLKLLLNLKLIQQRPVMKPDANKAVIAFELTERGRMLREELLEEVKRLNKLVSLVK